MFLFGIEDVVDEGADAIVRVKGLDYFVVLVIDADIVPFGVVLDHVVLEHLVEGLAVDPLGCHRFLTFLLRQFVHIGLEGILSFMFLEQTPSWISHEIISHPMHLDLRGQILIFLKHLQELSSIDFSLGFLLLVTDLLQFANILHEVLLLITDLE